MTLLVATKDSLYADTRMITCSTDIYLYGEGIKIHRLREGVYYASDGTVVNSSDYDALYVSFTRAKKSGTMMTLPGQKSNGIIIITAEGVWIQVGGEKFVKIEDDQPRFVGSVNLLAEGLYRSGTPIQNLFSKISLVDPTVSSSSQVIKVESLL